MDLLKTGKERWFCKLNAVLTFRGRIDDFACGGTKIVGEKIIQKEIVEIKRKLPDFSLNLWNFTKELNRERGIFISKQIILFFLKGVVFLQGYLQ
ncbi:MAG: hypothetical protein J7K17_05375 [Candidatus Omnitrophica bacterium]|nr:hypothetical protein [Candidatus Omnitrophota bacterium]